MGLRIGVDLDNTLVRYDHVFSQVADELDILRAPQPLSKVEIRATLREQGREAEWMRLQGQVYGQYMRLASPYAGVFDFLRRCQRACASVVIVSQRTLYGHFDQEQVNLREAALEWLEKLDFFSKDGLGLLRENVYFEADRDAKVARIAKLGLTYFIDDLPEVLEHPAFPKNVVRIHYAPGQSRERSQPFKTLPSWPDISREIFGDG
jgi:hypothetical protein